MSVEEDPLEIVKEKLEKLRSIQMTLNDESSPLDRKEIAKIMDVHLTTMEEQRDILIKITERERSQDEAKKSTIFGWFKSKSKKKVQIMNSVPTETTVKFIAALKKRMDADCKQLDKKDMIEPQLPLIILCPSSSRLKPDVDLALEGTKLPQQCIMIIIHTGEEDNLPSVPSAMKLSEYKSIDFLDMGFDHHNGIYDCNQNTNAIKKLQQFIVMFNQQQK